MLQTALREFMSKTYVTVPEEEVEGDLEDWETGVEGFSNHTIARLYEDLGSSEQKVADFNEFYDVNGEHDPWDRANVVWFQTESAARRPFSLRWHQLCAIVKIMDCILRKRGVLVMDAVGIGKTLEAIGVIVWRAYFFSVFKERNNFPGRFCE